MMRGSYFEALFGTKQANTSPRNVYGDNKTFSTSNKYFHFRIWDIFRGNTTFTTINRVFQRQNFSSDLQLRQAKSGNAVTSEMAKQ